MAEDPFFLSIGEACRLLGLRRSAFYVHILQPGRLRTAKIGRRVLIHRDDLAEFAETLRAEAAEEAERRETTWSV